MKKSFEEVFIDKTRYGTKIKTDEYCKSGKHIIVDQSQNAIAGFTDLDSGLFTDVPAIIFGDHTRVIKYVDEPFFLGADGTKILRSNICNANYKYLYYALKNARIPNTGYNRHFKWLKEIEIQYPDEKTQNNIASLLDKVLYVINLRKDELQKLDDLIRARFIELFGDPLIEDDRYPRVPLGSLAEVGLSKRIFEKEYVSEGIPFYRTKEIVELSKGNRITTELFITKERYDEIRSEYGVPQKGDLLISAVGTIGVIWIVDGKNDFYFKDGNLLRVSATEKFVPEYLKHLLEALISAYKSEMSSGTAYAALTISALKEMMVYDVPHAEQEQFAAFVEQIDKSKSHAPHLPIPPL